MTRTRRGIVRALSLFALGFPATLTVAQQCACEDLAIHLAEAPSPGLRCQWNIQSNVSLPTKVISHPKKRKVVLKVERCEADCRFITGCGIWEPDTWSYNAEGRETITGSLTQPSACNDAATVVGFAIEVCDKIGAAAAIQSIAGYITIASNTFTGITPWNHTCAQCYDREDEFCSEVESVDGTRSRIVKITWVAEPSHYPINDCATQPHVTQQVCPPIKVTVSRTVKTFHRIVYNEHCNPSAPQLCGIEVCP